jgi:hypothetical protein
MITVQILEANDKIDAEDWCRPLDIISMNGGHSDYYSFKSQYTGAPENNTKWVKVKYILGGVWLTKTVAEIDRELGKYLQYEFVRGDIPKREQLDLSGYNITDHSKVTFVTFSDTDDDEYDDDIPF